MEKAQIIEKALELLRARRSRLFESYETHRQASINAPSTMQSRHDTSRDELGKVADSAATQIEQLDRLIAHFEVAQREAKPLTRGQLGALMRVTEENRTFFVYLTPEGAGGEQIETEEGTVYTAAISSPIGRSLVGREIGDDTVFPSPTGRRALSVEDIQ